MDYLPLIVFPFCDEFSPKRIKINCSTVDFVIYLSSKLGHLTYSEAFHDVILTYNAGCYSYKCTMLECISCINS